MKVKELIKLLETVDPESVVFHEVSDRYGPPDEHQVIAVLVRPELEHLPPEVVFR